MRHIRSCLLTVTLGCVLPACGSDKDTTAPPAPRLEIVESPTTLERVVIRGTAEPGATIVMSGAEAFEPAEITADPFSAEFRVVATLKKDALNTLSFAAKDLAGNTSQTTELKVEQEVGHGSPSALKVDLFVNGASSAAQDPVRLAAGDTLRVAAQATDHAGHVLERALAVSTNIPNVFVAGPEVSNIRVAGTYFIGVSVAGSSLATSRSVTVTPGKTSQIALELTPQEVTAGTPVRISAVAKDEFGNAVPVDAIGFGSSPELAQTYTPPCSSMAFKQGFLDSQRFVVYDLSGAPNHELVLTARSGEVSASASLRVNPAAAARFAPLAASDCSRGDSFAFTDASWQHALSSSVSVAAGGSLYYRYGVVDAYGNPTTGPVHVVTSAPSAQVVDDGVSGVGQVTHLATAGAYNVSAYIAGVTTPAVRTFSVDVAAARSAAVFSSSSVASPGDTVYAFATIKDAFGNVVACPNGAVEASLLEILPSPASGVSGGAVTCSAGVFQRAFAFTSSGTYTLTTTYKDAGLVSASSFVTVLGIDATPPSVSVSNLRVNGVLCVPSGTPSACSVARGDTVELDLVGDDNVALSELEYSAFFQTTGTLRTRSVLQASDAALPAVVHFSFNVPGSVLPEDVALVGLAIDSSGNRKTTAVQLLRVELFGTFGRTATVVASGGSINGPSDIAFNAAGDMFIANDGDQNLVEVAHGSSASFVFSSYNRASRYIEVAESGDVYLTDAARITRVSAAGSSVVNYLSLASGTTQGLSILASSVAKGTLDASAASDGSTVTVASQVFELDSASDGCANGRVCVAPGTTTNNAALTAAINAQNVSVQASLDAGSGKIVLAAKSAGEAGNSLTLSTSGMVVSGATLTQGHAEELVLGQTNDSKIYRLPETLTPTAAITANHGMFDVGGTQRGVAVSDMTTVTGLAARNLYLYLIDGQNAGNLRAYHAVDASSPNQVFSMSSGGGQNFGTLYDVELVPSSSSSACLLVSDETQGKIYSVDTRDPMNTAPAVHLVASGLSEPRGLAYHAGQLYVADRALNAVIRITPTADTSDCF